MKRSEINTALRNMERMIKKLNYALPPFCDFTPDEWKVKGHEYDEIRENMLGWDITDFGLNKFEEVGFSLITIRNGNLNNPKYTKPYAEKLLYLMDGQKAPMHFHWKKMEDIINRGGGDVRITVYNSLDGKDFSPEDVTVYCDGVKNVVSAGTKILLKPGQSITIHQYLYHDFEAVPGTGDVLLGEVSMCNDDNTDNRFYEPIGRFPLIEEDEKPFRLLCNEYPEVK